MEARCVPGDKQQGMEDKRSSWKCVHGEAAAEWVELCGGWAGDQGVLNGLLEQGLEHKCKESWGKRWEG